MINTLRSSVRPIGLASHHHLPLSGTRRAVFGALLADRSPLNTITGRKNLACQALGDDRDSTGGLDPMLEVAVPSEQRPCNELKQLKQAQLYNWGTLEPGEYTKRLAGVFAFFFALIGGPIAYQTFDPFQQPIEWFLSGSTGSMVVVAVVVIRIYLGWSYVGQRLLSAAIAYEETGWYDGQTFIKPPEVLTRDRLLGMYEVKPVLRKLRSTLIGTGGLLLTNAVLLFSLIQLGMDADGMYGRGAGRAAVRQVTSDGVVFSSRIQSLQQVLYDDELAAEEAAAQGNMPGYCNDRYFRAMAGGQYCPPDVK